MKYSILKRDANITIPVAKEELKAVFPQFSEIVGNTPIYLISDKNALVKRNKIAIEIGALQEDSNADTASRALIGKDSNAIVMYYNRIPKYLFKHFLFHEFGHIISTSETHEIHDEVQKDMLEDNDTELKCGSALWSEMIAEVFAYRAERNEFTPYCGYADVIIEERMDKAVNTGYLSVYDLAFYMAMFFEDPEIISFLEMHPNAAIGANHCDDEIMPLIEHLLELVYKPINKDDFWKISRETMEEFGKAVNEVWDYCAEKMKDALLKRLFE